MGNTMYPYTAGSVLMCETTFGLPVPSQQGPMVGEDGELKKEVAQESSYLLPTPLGNSLGQTKLYTVQERDVKTASTI